MVATRNPRFALREPRPMLTSIVVTSPSNAVPRMAPHEMVLDTLAKLFESDPRPKVVSYELLSIRAHEQYPEQFGLKEFPQIPDTSIVRRLVDRNHVLRHRTFIKGSVRLMRLTPKGVAAVQALRARLEAEASRLPPSDEVLADVPDHLKLTKTELNELKCLYESPTLQKHLSGGRLDRSDAREFWGVGPRCHGYNCYKRIDNLLRKAQSSQTVNRRAVSEFKLSQLVTLHNSLYANHRFF